MTPFVAPLTGSFGLDRVVGRMRRRGPTKRRTLNRPRGLPDAELEGRPHLVVDDEAREPLLSSSPTALLEALDGGADEARDESRRRRAAPRRAARLAVARLGSRIEPLLMAAVLAEEAGQ